MSLNATDNADATHCPASELITDNIDIWTSAIKKRNATGRGSSKKIELTGIKKLRELILELAVRGKLVPQDANDEPASVLLDKIAVEKAQLIADKTIKKTKALPVITDEEKPFELPSCWEWSKLQNIGHDLGQKKPDQDFTYIDVASINKELGFIEEPNILAADNAPSRARKLVKKGTVIYSTVRPYLLNIAVINDDFSPEPIASTAFSIIHPLRGVLASYVYRYLRSPIFISYVESVQTGIAYPAINDKQFFSGLIAIPPEAEQYRIVAKVDELMILCDQLEQQTEQSLTAHQTLVEVLLGALFKPAEGSATENAESFQTSWQRIAEHFDLLFTTELSIEQLKQTILQIAVMGKLVPQNPSDEPASVLLEKIAEEKAQLIANKKIKKQTLLPTITDDKKPFELPNGWSYTRLDDLCANVVSGSTPPKSELNETSGIPFLKVYNIQKQEIEFEQRTLFVTENSHHGKLKRSILYPGDVLLNIVGPPLGKVAIIPNTYPEWNCNQNIVCFRPLEIKLNNYIYTYLKAHIFLDYIDLVGSAGQDFISGAKCRAIVLPMPPLAEQQRIVAKVDELMALCEQLKARLSDAQTTQLHLADAVVTNALS